MDTVRLQCHICFTVAEIKNNFLQPADAINMVPIVELHLCKHQMCVTCVRKIAQRNRDKRLECPMCRRKNAHFNVYSVNRNVVEVLRCGVNEVREQVYPRCLVDAGSLARNVFEKSILLETEYNEPATTPDDLRIVLTRLQEQINEQTKLNYTLHLQSETLTLTNEAIERRIEKSRNDYSDACKQMEAVRNIRIKEERALKTLADKRTQWAKRNAKLEQENQQLTNENIKLIKDNNLFKNR
uniref:Cg30 n=1 Tax=Anticarsia gemmatalis multiple nucleopolyhedrovirus TaxID=268591 RepID=A0A0S3J0F3_9ABAC|nr:cg30 [Anticarsia gemmatalis multiple nucleopolyhedrovirus]ALR70510.1 cg30 [Anticarsia gemmatalis multiple nucleopolyhedrovirus]ALR71767.1 cg30 [Anticarsia gemmatalis multiple nucleopolyhedrovirus]ALR72397.1 cg30 [Anticarsia gemmatalis multiple nucleopolyhedrovirus]